MKILRQLLCLVVIAPAAFPARAQEPVPPEGVRLALAYSPGARPSVLVLPVDGAEGDSVRAIIQRDLDYDDRVTLIMLESTAARALLPGAGREIDLGRFAPFGATAIIEPRLTASGVSVRIYDVSAGKLARSADFALPVDVYGPGWRMALHGVSDELGLWIFGERGAARTRVLYTGGDGQIWVIDSDGANARRLTSVELALSPAWRPDGSGFAFAGVSAGRWRLGVSGLAAGSTRWLRSTPARGITITPAFTPDGGSIAYAHGDESGTNLWMVSASDDGAPRRLTPARSGDNTGPSFDPAGRRIVFTSGRAGQPDLYLMGADGTNAQPLTTSSLSRRSDNGSPDWSPDGLRVAYQSQVGGAFQIVSLALRDRSTKQHTSDGENEDPSWAPDSRHVVFSSTRTGARQLWVVDTQSGRLRQLTRTAGARLPDWSPFLPR
ncbi:Tol-Pal system beta propeller repeat protein TolB [soil metagenome]